MKSIGVIMLALPFAAIFVVGGVRHGWDESIRVFAATGAFVLWVMTAAYLIVFTGNKKP